MAYEFNYSLDFLKKDNTNLKNNGQDGSTGITAPNTFENVSIVQNGDGTWSQSSIQTPSKVKKDINIRQDELNQHEGEVNSLKTFAKISDDKIISIATQINQKKQLIIDKIGEAISAGCSVGIGTSGIPAIVNGITLGVGVTVTLDYPYIKKYTGLDDPTAQIPFESDDTVTLSTSNSGDGYFSGFLENGGSSVGIYKSVFNAGLASPPTICADRTAEILALANEIDALRTQIDRTLITNTNTIKDRKTTSEVFVWGYKSRDHKIQNQINANNTAIGTIENILIGDGIIVQLDAFDIDSYSGIGTIWNNLVENKPDAVLKRFEQWNNAGYMTYGGPGEDDETLISNVGIDTNLGITVEQIIYLNDGNSNTMPFTFYDVALDIFYYGDEDEFGFNNSNGLVYGITNADEIFVGNWVHYIAYFPPNWSESTYEDAKLWINGTKQTLSIVNGTVSAKPLSSTQTMAIGGGYTSGLDTYTWNGRIAITNIYNQELTDAQVQEKYSQNGQPIIERLNSGVVPTTFTIEDLPTLP